MVGFVRSNVMLTFLQVFSRVGIVWGVIQPVPEVRICKYIQTEWHYYCTKQCVAQLEIIEGNWQQSSRFQF